MSYNWQIQTAPDASVREYMRELNTSRILASALIRNKVSIEMAGMIFDPDNYDGIFDSLSIQNIQEAAALLKEYLEKPNAMIQVFADYDTDGITSATIACKGLQQIVANVYQGRNIEIGYYIPERKDGYGLSVDYAKALVEKANNAYADREILVVTVDNGITAKPAVDILQAQPNIRVLVTDHHLPDYENNLTPDKDCICVDPQTGSQETGKFLAGCGVIFNVLQALESLYGLKHHPATVSLYYLAAIGTIGDMMNMDLYNACLVQAGLGQLNREDTLPWVNWLKDKAGIPRFTTKDIAFTVSPMINACGQMGKASLAFDLLVSEKPDEMLELVSEVYKVYQTNKNETKDIREQAEIDILTNYVPKHPFVMYPLRTDHPGLASKVATHLAKQVPAPIILWAETEENAEEEIIAGSARNDTSLPVLPILREAVKEGLVNSAEGHAYAFGIKLYRSKLPQLQEFLDKKVRSYGHDIGADMSKKLVVDCVITTDEINVKNMRDIERFPFAKNLAAPVVMIQGARICKAKASKNNPKNICYTIQSPGTIYPIDIWAWNIKPDEYDPNTHTKIDMVGTIERNFMKPDYATLSVIDLRTYAE